MLPHQQQQHPIFYPAPAVAASAGGGPPRPPSLAPLPTSHPPHHHHHHQAPQSFPAHRPVPLALGVGQPTLGIGQPPLASLSFPAHPSLVSGFPSTPPIPLSGQALTCSQAQTLHHNSFQLNGCNLPLGHGQNVPPASVFPPNPHHPGTMCNGNFRVQCPPVQTGQFAHHPFHGQLPFVVPYAQSSVAQQSLPSPNYLPPTDQPHTSLPAGPGPPAALQNHSPHLGAALQHQRVLQGASSAQGNLQGCDSSGMAIGYPVMGIPVQGDGTYSTPLPNVSGPQPWQHTHYAWEAGVLGSQGRPIVSSESAMPIAHGGSYGSFSNDHPESYLHCFSPEGPVKEDLGRSGGILPPTMDKSVRLQPEARNGDPVLPGLSSQQDLFTRPSRNSSRLQESWQETNLEKMGSNRECILNQEPNPVEPSATERAFRRSAAGDCKVRNFGGAWSNHGGGGRGRGRGRNSYRDVQYRSEVISLRCDPCDRTFTSSNDMEAHMSSHGKCNEEGCLFEASGKTIKEHMVSEHGKKSAPTTDRGLKAAALRSKETEEDIRHWREERKLNYPTTANIRRKTEEMKARKARGELVDEGEQKRRQRLREILARQAELGLPVAEIPTHYLSDRLCKRKRHETVAEKNSGPQTRGLYMQGSPTVDKKESVDVKKPRLSSDLEGEPREGALDNHSKERGHAEEESAALGLDVKERKEALEDVGVKARQAGRHSICRFFLRGHCKKGSRCEFLHERRARNRDGDSNAPYVNCSGRKRVPTLLSKLLEPEIRRDKSHLLQCFRFIVNNSFLVDWPNKPLEFFEWVGLEDTGSDSGGIADEAQGSLVLGSQQSADRGQSITGVNKESQLREQVKKSISSISGEDENKFPQDVNLDIEGTDPVDLWLELQQRLIEDAGSLGCFEDGF